MLDFQRIHLPTAFKNEKNYIIINSEFTIFVAEVPLVWL